MKAAGSRWTAVWLCGVVAGWITGAGGWAAGGESVSSTAFGYQGHLAARGVNAEGPHDLMFSLFDAPAGGTQVGQSVTNRAVPVVRGMFTVLLDFGAEALVGGSRWLEIRVRAAGEEAFTLLEPRQPLMAAPYAISALHALRLGGASPAQVDGALTVSGPQTNLGALYLGQTNLHALVLSATQPDTLRARVLGERLVAAHDEWELYDDFQCSDQIGQPLAAPTGHQYWRNGYGRETWGISNGVLSAWHEGWSDGLASFAPRLGVLLSNTPTSINFELSLRASAAPDPWTYPAGFCISVSTNQLIPADDSADMNLAPLIHLNHYINIACGGVNLATNTLNEGVDLTWNMFDSNSVDGAVWERPHTNEHFVVSLARVATNTLRFTVKNYAIEFSHPLVGALWGRSLYFQVYPNTGSNLLDRAINIHRVWAGYSPAEAAAARTREIAEAANAAITGNGNGTNVTVLAADHVSTGNLSVTGNISVRSGTFTNDLVVGGSLYGSGAGISNLLESSLTWMMPDNLFIASGYEANFYNIGLAYRPADVARYRWNGSGNQGYAWEDRYQVRWTPTNAWITNGVSLGGMVANRVMWNTSRLIIAPTNAGQGVTRNVLLVGDSTIEGGQIASELRNLFRTNVMNVLMHGTKGGNLLATSPGNFQASFVRTNWLSPAAVQVFPDDTTDSDHSLQLVFPSVRDAGHVFIAGWFKSNMPTNNFGIRPFGGLSYGTNIPLSTNWTFERFACPVASNSSCVHLLMSVDGFTSLTLDTNGYFTVSNLTAYFASTNQGRHEGREGWTFSHYATNPSSPFVWDGELNFARYAQRQDLSLGSNDWVVFQLGINSIGNSYNDAVLRHTIAAEWRAASNLIRSIKQFNPSLRVALTTVWMGADSQDAWAWNYGISYWSRDSFRYNESVWNNHVVTRFAEIGAHAVIPLGANIDPIWGFPTATAQHSMRVTNTVTRFSNALHPSATGYLMLADGYYHFLKANE